MEALIRALPKLISAAGDNEEVAEAAVGIAWRRVAGEPLSQHAVPFRLFHKTFVVAVSDAIWQKQMIGLSAQMLSRLNALLGHGTVSFIEFRVDPETVAKQRASHRGVTNTPAAEEVLASVPKDLLVAANSIPDEGLRRRFLLAAGASILRQGR